MLKKHLATPHFGIDAASVAIRQMPQMPAAAKSQAALNSFGYGFYQGCKNGKYNFAIAACSNLAHEGAEVLPRRAFTDAAIYTIAESLVGCPVQISHKAGSIATIDRAAVIKSALTFEQMTDINIMQTLRDGYLRVIVQCSGPIALQQFDMSRLGASVGFEMGGFAAGKTSKGGYARITADRANELSLVQSGAIPDCGVITSPIEGQLLRGYGYG